jgi:hypothetical protein
VGIRRHPRRVRAHIAVPGVAGMLAQVRRRTPLAWAALVGNGMTWFGAAAFLLGLAGEHVDAVSAGFWPQIVGFALIVTAGIGLAIGGVLDNRRIRTGRLRPH